MRVLGPLVAFALRNYCEDGFNQSAESVQWCQRLLGQAIGAQNGNGIFHHLATRGIAVDRPVTSSLVTRELPDSKITLPVTLRHLHSGQNGYQKN